MFVTQTKEIKLTITIRAPHLPRIGLVHESEKEVQKRVLKLHQKFGLKRRSIDQRYRGRRVDVSKYHSELFKLSQDQFAQSLLANWRKHYLTLDGKKKWVFLVGPF